MNDTKKNKLNKRYPIENNPILPTLEESKIWYQTRVETERIYLNEFHKIESEQKMASIRQWIEQPISLDDALAQQQKLNEQKVLRENKS